MDWSEPLSFSITKPGMCTNTDFFSAHTGWTVRVILQEFEERKRIIKKCAFHSRSHGSMAWKDVTFVPSLNRIVSMHECNCCNVCQNYLIALPWMS